MGHKHRRAVPAHHQLGVGTGPYHHPRPISLALLLPPTPADGTAMPGSPGQSCAAPQSCSPGGTPPKLKVSGKESLFICLIKKCSPGTQTPFHLSHLEPCPSKIKPNKYQKRESKGHM